MENDGIKWNMVEYGSCLKHFGSCDDLKSVKTWTQMRKNEIHEQTFPPPQAMERGGGGAENKCNLGRARS